MNYQKLILVGNATRDAERKTSKKSKLAYTTLGVGVSDAKGQSTFFAVTAFGKLGESVAKYVTKGRQVLVEGRITVSESSRFNVVADRIFFGASDRSDQDKKTK